jgi:hypothetical protein
MTSKLKQLFRFEYKGLTCRLIQQWLTLRKFQGKSNFTLQPDQPRYVCLTARVIAQQYSSATSSSLRFHSRNEKFF